MRLIDADALEDQFSEIVGEYTVTDIQKIISNAQTVPLPDFKAGYKQAILDGKTNFSRPKGEWIRLDSAKRVIARFKGYLDDDMIERIQIALEKEYKVEMQKGGTDCMDEDAKQASIPYTYNAPQHDWKCGYPDITRDKGGAEK